MSDSDELQRGALERALYSIIQDVMESNGAGAAGAAAASAADAIGSALPDAASAANAAVGEIRVGKPQSIFRWLMDAKKQIAPHADKVPLPIVQGLAKTVFPPAGAVVPVIRYLQTPASSKHKSAASLEVGLAPATSATAVPPQVYIIPVVQPPPPENKQAVAIRRTVQSVLGFAGAHPLWALLVVYASWRARVVPGRVFRAVDRLLNVVWVFVARWVERRTRERRVWAKRKAGEVKAKITGYTPQADVPVPAAEPETVDDGIQLDIGDAVWVIVATLVSMYIAYNRKKVLRR